MGLERLLEPKKADSGTPPKDCLECKIVGVTTLSLSGGQPTLHAGEGSSGEGGREGKGKAAPKKERQLTFFF